MAEFSAEFADRLLAHFIRQLTMGETTRLHLVTGQQQGRVELVTVPPGEHSMVITPEMHECRFEDLPECVVEYVDFYDQDGVRFMRAGYGWAIAAGNALTVPLYVRPW